MTWMDDANCKGKTNLFFPAHRERAPQRAEREAKARALCEACTVRKECRDAGAANHEFGIWGGEPADVFATIGADD